VANDLVVVVEGDVGFIDWLGLSRAMLGHSHSRPFTRTPTCPNRIEVASIHAKSSAAKTVVDKAKQNSRVRHKKSLRVILSPRLSQEHESYVMSNK
jgi:hypothetical protein